MKRKIYLLSIVITCCGSMFALPKAASEPQLFIKGNQAFMSPSWSPDGKYLAVTGDNYDGIWIADANGANLTQLTSDAGAGYKLCWSKDGKTILARTNQTVEKRKFHEIKTYEVANGKSEVLVQSTRGITGTPLWDAGSSVRYSDKGSNTLIKASKAIEKVAVASLYERMVSNPIDVSKEANELVQFSGKAIINPALSPDNSKIAFQVVGKGLYVCDANGDNIKSLGKGSYPSWLPDNQTIVVSKVVDNGETFTSSDLYAIDVNTNKSIVLTNDSNLIPITLSVSPDGKKVAFENSVNGGIYIINLKY